MMKGFELMVVSCCLLAAAGAIPRDANAAAAAWQPGRNVTLIPPTGPGGGNDRIARMIQKLLKDGNLVESNILVLNKPGAGGELAWSYLNQFAGDGNYLALAPNNLLTNHIVRGKAITYTDVTPLSVLFAEYNVVLVSKDSPFRTGSDLAAAVKKNSGAVSVGLALGPGAPSHIAFVMVVKAAGGDVKRPRLVSFKSAQEGVTALLGGHIDVFATNAGNATQFIEAGELRALGTTSPRRMGGPYAKVATFREQGYDAVLLGWRALIGPKGLSGEQVAYWDATLSKLVKMPEWREFLEKELREDIYMNSRQSAAFMKQDYQQLKTIFSELGVATVPQ